MELVLEDDSRKNSISTNDESILVKNSKLNSKKMRNELIERYLNSDLVLKYEDIELLYSEYPEEQQFDDSEEDTNNLSIIKEDVSLYTKINEKMKFSRCGCCSYGKVRRAKVNIASFRITPRNTTNEILSKSNKPTTLVNTLPFQHLKENFALANIKLKLINTPVDFNFKRTRFEPDTKNFLMDLRKNDGEYIVIFPGVNTKINVTDINKEFHQVIMTVEEPERTLEVKENVKVENKWIVKTTYVTSEAEQRNFLIGYDEGHLFVARLNSNALTVKEAHLSLKPFKIKNKKKGTYIRQGECFFTPINYKLHFPEDQVFEYNVTVGRGKGHRVQIKVDFNGKTFYKGAVTHPEHKTIFLEDWHSYVINNENTKHQNKGMLWID